MYSSNGSDKNKTFQKISSSLRHFFYVPVFPDFQNVLQIFSILIYFKLKIDFTFFDALKSKFLLIH